MKNNILRFLIITFVAVGLVFGSGMTVNAEGPFNIREGAEDENKYGYLHYLEDPTEEDIQFIQDVIDSNGFSPEVEAEMQAAVNEARAKLNGQASEPVTEQSQALVSTPAPATTPKKCEHDYVSEIVKLPTCEAEGEMRYKCSLCGDKYTEPVPIVLCEFIQEMTKNPTCTEQGEITYTCIMCGASKTEKVDMLEHEEGVWSMTKQVTCLENGERVLTCKHCGEILQTDVVMTPGHTASEWEIYKQPGIFTPGENIKKCISCDTIIESVAAAPHIQNPAVIGIIVVASLAFIVTLSIVVKRRRRRQK